MIAVIPVRSGRLPAGAEETSEEAGGVALVVGSGTREGAAVLCHGADVRSVRLLELGAFAPAAWGERLCPLLRPTEVVLLPASPDGRDLAPRLARALARPLLAGAAAVFLDGAEVVRSGGRQLVRLSCDGPFVATLLPGSRACGGPGSDTEVETIEIDLSEDARLRPDATSVEEVEPTPSTLALAAAARVVVAGGGVAGAGLAPITELASLLGAGLGVTRVVSDSGLVPHDRQIGTSGVSISPRLHLAFGVSGAPQHVAAIGQPAHIVSVNRDPGCPMMQMADLAVVSDAAATAEQLCALLAGGDE